MNIEIITYEAGTCLERNANPKKIGNRIQKNPFSVLIAAIKV